ncbi:MAG: RecB-family nuclease [Caldisphaeraceae archaeon]|nr:RecB-family nuclease [Caldisphaeraceae archaeon]
MEKAIPLLHNVSGVQKVLDMAKLAFALGFDELVLTKVYGAAAQSGVAEAFKIALREGKGLVVLPEMKDALELYRPDTLYLVDRDHAKEEVDPFALKVNGLVMIAFNGSDTSFSPLELSLGKPIYLKNSKRLGCIAEASLILYGIKR